jgi:hypothetical protein
MLLRRQEEIGAAIADAAKVFGEETPEPFGETGPRPRRNSCLLGAADTLMGVNSLHHSGV